MASEYKIAFYGIIISLLSFIPWGIVAAIIVAVNRDSNLLGLAYISLSQISLPIIGKLPLLPFETVALMAAVDLSASNAYLMFGLGILGALLLAAGSVMVGYGFYGLYKQEQNTLCLITALIMMIGFGALAVIIPLGLLPTTTLSPWSLIFYHYFSLAIPLTQTTISRMWLGVATGITALIVIVGYILMGVTMITIRTKTPKPDNMLAAGILSILGGLLFLGVIGIVLVFVAYILLAQVFDELRK
ncbi:MAG: hypothetical protein KIH10_01345 [Candidatus Freyarchaeota archaeon]|nr:hypothetical protein [Candidatus Jordarchaeia archaeon]MBS7279367.1 hypothetical protein [Candidatus Jordarchaeia archaeon]